MKIRKVKKSVQEQVKENFPEFYEACQTLSVEEINGRLAQTAKDGQATDEAKEADEEYRAAKANASDLGAPYRDAKKAIKLRARYLIVLLKDRGAI